jgi:exosortase B
MDAIVSQPSHTDERGPGVAEDGDVRPSSARAKPLRLAAAGILLLGLASIAAPTLLFVAQESWSKEQGSHGPIVLFTGLWLLWRQWPDARELAARPRGLVAGVILAACLVFYALSRITQIVELEGYAMYACLLAVLYTLVGAQAMKRMWFPLFFMLFMIPLPGTVVDALTQPMKLAVSYVAENILYRIGYPISRTGVILQIGQYQLLVADACAGLHTLFTLEALGLLYLNLVRHASVFRNVALAILIVPISFCANVIRVMVLTLITYHFGDEAGQGFLHGFAGLVLFMAALLLITATDSLLRLGVRHKAAA